MTSEKLETEETLIRSVLENDEILEVQLIEETETNLDLLLIVTPDEYIQAYVRPLSRIGYSFYPKDSTIIKLFFQKGDSFKYNLYLTQTN